jgi:F-type H+-transporting ATPase subunit alpha
VLAFEDGLLGALRNQHADILTDIRDTRALSDATTAKLKNVVEGFAKTFA